jgi:phosphatidylglycerol lysyltransferase
VNEIKKIVNWVEKRMLIFKLIFVLSVLIFVFFEFGRIAKQMSWTEISHDLMTTNPVSIVIMLVVGFLAVTPMLIYDVVMVSFVPGKFSWKYLLKSGWITNTFTNLLGFGGLIGATLRANFYSKKATKSQIIAALSKIAIFLLSGLSLCCWLALFAIGCGLIKTGFSQYLIWLVGGGLYFPLVLIFTLKENHGVFRDLNTKQETLLIAGSAMEWLSVSLFFVLIGWLLGVNQKLPEVFMLYIVSSILGIISLVPGGLGSFDVFMLIGLETLGVPSATTAVWLLFYRIFYYILPFTLGVIFFIHSLGSKINEYLDGLPSSIMHKAAHGILTLLLYSSGILILLDAMVPNFAFNNNILIRFYPYTLFFVSQLTSVLCGFMLFGLARGIEARIKRAYWPTIIFLILGMIDTVRYGFSWGVLTFLSLVLILVIFSRKELYRQRFVYSSEKLFLDGSFFAIIAILYAIIGAINSPHYILHHHIPAILIFPSERTWFSGFIGLLLAAGILWLTFNYLSNFGMSSIDELPNLDRAKKVIEKFGGNETSHLAYLKDKCLFFYQAEGEDQLFLMYRHKANKLIVMGEPVGNRKYLNEAVSQLLRLADLENCQLVFYEINSELTLLLHELGFDFIKMGEEGLVDITNFTLSGKKQRGQRALMNKLARNGYTFEILQPPFSAAQLNQLHNISDEWLAGQLEKGFSMGFFDEDYLQRAPIAVVRDSKETIVAFANLMPVNQEILSVDLMRYGKEIADGAMDMIFIKLFEYGQAKGYHYFNLGMAPLANVGYSKYSFLEEKAAHLLYEYGSHFYGFQGLRSYKNKYVTDWRSKYTAYRRRSSILVTMLQLTSVINRHQQIVKRPTVPLPAALSRWLNVNPADKQH